MRTSGMKPLRTIMLAILIVLFTINFVGIYVGFIINRTILQSTFLIETLRGQEAYAQIRQLMFRMVNKSLPNGQDGIPYLEKAISEGWLEQEINMLLKSFYAFAKGERGDTPTISFYNLKKQVANALDENKPYQERTRLVQFWFDPLPDEVNLEDFMSINFLWGTRNAVSLIAWIPWVICGSALIIIILIYLVVMDWRQLTLWIGAGGIAAGALLIFLGLIVERVIGRMSIVMNIAYRFIAYGIPEASVNNFLTALINGITNPTNIIGTISILIGGAIVYFVPIDERVLTLVK